MRQRPVLYLDLDDTLVSWATGQPVAAPAAAPFVTWALQHFEVRWLTTWCPDGEMPDGLLHDLARLLRLPVETLGRIRGIDWAASGCKLDGIAWLEHRVLGRPFAWVEDEKGFRERERDFLARNRMLGSYYHCNVTDEVDSLSRVWESLRARYGSVPSPPGQEQDCG